MSNTQNQWQDWPQDGIYKTWATKKEVVAVLRYTTWLGECVNSGRFLRLDRDRLKDAEMAPPSYAPVRYKDGWGVKEITHFHPRVTCPRKSGRRVVCIRTIDPDLPPIVNILMEEEVIHIKGTHIKHFSKK